MVTRFRYWYYSKRLFGAVTSAKIADPDKYSNSGYGIGFDSLFSFSDFGWYKNGVIFGVYNSSSVHIDNKKKDICVLGKNLAQELDHRTIIFQDQKEKSFEVCIVMEATVFNC